MPNKVWHEGDADAVRWFEAGSSLGIPWEPAEIPNPGSAGFLALPEAMKKILSLDCPDLVVTIDQAGVDVPVLSIEITTTTPQGQHPKQRVPRLIAAAEASVPAIYIIPGQKKASSGDRVYHLGCDLHFIVRKIERVNSVPVYIYRYPEDDGEPLHDKSFLNQPLLSHMRMQRAFRTIDAIVGRRLAGENIADLYTDPWLSRELERHRRVAARADMTVDKFGTLSRIKTADLGAYLKDNTSMTDQRIYSTLESSPPRIQNREDTLVFHPAGRMFDHAGDPYVGMIASFDYAFCRVAPSVEARHTNLVYLPRKEEINSITDKFGPEGFHRYWKDRCAFRKTGVPSIDDQFQISHHLQYGCVFAKKKPLRIYGYFADIVVLRDAMLVF